MGMFGRLRGPQTTGAYDKQRLYMEPGSQRLTSRRSKPSLPGEYGQYSAIYGQTGPGQIQVPDDTHPVYQ